MNSEVIAAIETRIGYKFNDVNRLIAAFTHSSYVNEHKSVGNERIEFLGECGLNFLVGEKLFKNDRTAKEGELSSRRAAIVSRAPLARIVDSLGFIEYLRVGAGVDKAGFSMKARSDVFEALLGAVYLDGGLDACAAVLETVYYPYVEPEIDHKSLLQRYAASLGIVPVYTVKPSDPGYTATVTIGEHTFTGEGVRKHYAEISAARLAVTALCPAIK